MLPISINFEITPVRGMRAGRLSEKFLLENETKGLVAPNVRGEPIPIAERRIGVDTSHWEGLINWLTCFNAGGRFAYIKASQGTNIKDNQFENSRTNIIALNSFPWGSYHFLTTSDPVRQANWFCDTIGTNRGQLPPVCDVELPAVSGSVVKAFAIRVYERLGIYPLIYTSAYFWDLVTGSDKVWCSEHCGLFVAHWDTLSPILPMGWANYYIHQYSAEGKGLGPMYGSGDADMDLDYVRQPWLDQFWVTPPPPPPVVYEPMDLNSFINLYTGRMVDFDGVYPSQCMDLVHFYVYICQGIHDKSVLSKPYAKDVWLNWNPAWDQYYTRVVNGPTNYPSPGDIIVWNMGTFGHIAICVDANSMNFHSFDANYPTGSLPHIQYHTYNSVLGWLVKK